MTPFRVIIPKYFFITTFLNLKLERTWTVKKKTEDYWRLQQKSFELVRIRRAKSAVMSSSFHYIDPHQFLCILSSSLGLFLPLNMVCSVLRLIMYSQSSFKTSAAYYRDQTLIFSFSPQIPSLSFDICRIYGLV